MRAWAAFVGAGLVFAAVLVVLAGVLPERVPLHFGPSLEAGRVGDRTRSSPSPRAPACSWPG